MKIQMIEFLNFLSTIYDHSKHFKLQIINHLSEEN